LETVFCRNSFLGTPWKTENCLEFRKSGFIIRSHKAVITATDEQWIECQFGKHTSKEIFNLDPLQKQR